MPIIIDGWNFIRNEKSHIDDEEGDALESAAILIKYLEHFQSTHSDPIVLVFDSSREHLGIDYKNNSKLTIVATRNADNYIKRYIENYPERQRRNIRVVSSDSSVYYYAKSYFATPVKSEEFWHTLNRSNKKGVRGQGACTQR